VARERDQLAMTAADWASWDDTYRFVQDGNPEFVTTNLSEESLANLGWHAVWFVAEDGRVVLHRARGAPTGGDVSFPELPSDRFPAGHSLLPRQSLTQTVTGLVRTAAGPLLVASRPILTSQRSGPRKGWLIVGRLLTPAALESLSRANRVHFHLDDAVAPALDPDAADALAEVRRTGELAFRAVSDDDLHAYGVLHDMAGDAAYVLCTHVPRGISQQGMQSMRVASVFMLVACAAIVALLFVLLRVTVATPLRRLTEHAERIGRSGDLSSRSGIERNDEIGKLAAAFDDMVGKLAESRAQLTDAARRVGMAEVARDVLHNVGNVLTGVNVSAGNVADTLRRSRVEGLLRGLELIRQNRGRLDDFLERDERGRMLPEFLAKSADALRDERTTLIEEADRIRRNVEHAAEIVKRQDVFASSPAPTLAETLTLASAVEGATALVEPGFRKRGIRLERRVAGDVEFVADRAKLTQILVNLLTNARDALSSQGGDDRCVTLSAQEDGGCVRIEVADNGCGMSAETRARIFESGFSTKGGGRGVGLHYCALAAREMGGRLRAASEGAGHGATFTLELGADADRCDSQVSATAAPAARGVDDHDVPGRRDRPTAGPAPTTATGSCA
jgi:signal transduction histidine kinase